MKDSIENSIISFIDTNIGNINSNGIKLIKIHHGHSINFDSTFIQNTVKDKHQLDVIFMQHPIQITCEWCAMESSVLNTNFVCKFCGKQTELIHEDTRIAIQFIPIQTN